MSNDSVVHSLVREHGRETTSFQVLGSEYRHWIDRDGCVAFTEVGNSWITVGGAIAPEHRELEVIERFTKEAHQQGKRVRFFCLERDISSESSLNTIHLGDQPVWDPALWPQNLSKKLREQLRRARTKGIVTTRLAAPEEIENLEHPTRRGIDAVINRWLESRRSAPMGFLIALDPFHRVRERRVFLAENPEGRVVGLMVALPIYGRNGWFIDNMMRDPSAPNGTVELMFDCAMRTLAAEGSSYVTLGLSPFVGVSSKFIQFIRDSFGYLYNFKGLFAFKTKLRPASWHPVYLAYPKRESGILAILDAITAFLPGGWLRFAWNSSVQRATLSAALLAGFLLPWTGLLALLDSGRWFPSPAVHAGWVGFNLILTALLFALSRRWRSGLALTTAALGVVDGALSAAQLGLYNAGRAPLGDWPWLALAVAGPLALAAWAWSSRHRAQLYLRPAVTSQARPAADRVLVPAPRKVAHSTASAGRRAATANLVNDRAPASTSIGSSSA